MRILDPHIHMTRRTTDDYEAMYAAGVRAVVEPAFWLGQPRTSVGSFTDYFDALIGWERFRAAQFGIRHHCTIGAQPQGGERPALPRGARRAARATSPRTAWSPWARLGLRLHDARGGRGVRARSSRSRGTSGFPRLVHTPHRDKARGHARTLDVVRESGISPGAGASSTTSTRRRSARCADAGCWMGFSIYPDTKMDERRMVAMLQRVRHRADDRELRRGLGAFRPAQDRARPARRCSTAGFTERRRRRVLWQQPRRVLRAERAPDLDPVPGFSEGATARARLTFEGNSVLRGVRPRA